MKIDLDKILESKISKIEQTLSNIKKHSQSVIRKASNPFEDALTGDDEGGAPSSEEQAGGREPASTEDVANSLYAKTRSFFYDNAFQKTDEDYNKYTQWFTKAIQKLARDYGLDSASITEAKNLYKEKMANEDSEMAEFFIKDVDSGLDTEGVKNTEFQPASDQEIEAAFAVLTKYANNPEQQQAGGDIKQIQNALESILDGLYPSGTAHGIIGLATGAVNRIVHFGGTATTMTSSVYDRVKSIEDFGLKPEFESEKQRMGSFAKRLIKVLDTMTVMVTGQNEKKNPVAVSESLKLVRMINQRNKEAGEKIEELIDRHASIKNLFNNHPVFKELGVYDYVIGDFKKIIAAVRSKVGELLQILMTQNPGVAQAFVIDKHIGYDEKFAELLLRLDGPYPLEDIVEVVTGKQADSIIYRHAYFFLEASMDSMKAAEVVLNEIIDDIGESPEVAEAYLEDYVEDSETAVDDFVSTTPLSKDEITEMLEEQIDENVLNVINQNITHSVNTDSEDNYEGAVEEDGGEEQSHEEEHESHGHEHGENEPEQSSDINEFMEKTHLSPELFYKLVEASKKSNFKFETTVYGGKLSFPDGTVYEVGEEDRGEGEKLSEDLGELESGGELGGITEEKPVDETIFNPEESENLEGEFSGGGGEPVEEGMPAQEPVQDNLDKIIQETVPAG